MISVLLVCNHLQRELRLLLVYEEIIESEKKDVRLHRADRNYGKTY